MELLNDDVLKQQRFATVAQRRENRDVLTEEIDRVLSSHTTEHWLEVLKGKIPCAPVYDLPQAMNNPYIRDIGMVRKVPHSANPDMEILGNPIKIDGKRLDGAAAVSMGESTNELLQELGYGEQDIVALKSAGAI